VFVLINTVMRRQRRRLVALAAVFALAGAVTVAHSAMGGDHMGQGTAMCVAVLAVAGLAVLAAVAGAPRSWLPVRWTAPRLAAPRGTWPAPVPQPRARADPSALQVFRL
jgi:peptidoglycan/LPS O-acetylase OafA/YrhL